MAPVLSRSLTSSPTMASVPCTPPFVFGSGSTNSHRLKTTFLQSKLYSRVVVRCEASAVAEKEAPQSSAETHAQVERMSSGLSQDLELSSLSAICPLDGRYWGKVKELAPSMSEYGLTRFRILVEVKWLLKLSQIPQISEVPSFSEGAQTFLQDVIDGFGMDDALEVKKIERVTNHDVKAVEYFLKQRCQSHPEIVKVLEFFHFACTSEDINNLAHALMLKGALNTVILPIMDELIRAICDMATAHSSVSMLSRSHGQPASPTTIGKEMAIFAYQLSRERRDISKTEMFGKFAGAVGNYNAHVSAYPEINWPQIAEEFVTSLGLNFNPYVPQIEPHDYMAKLFHSLSSSITF